MLYVALVIFCPKVIIGVFKKMQLIKPQYNRFVVRLRY